MSEGKHGAIWWYRWASHRIALADRAIPIPDSGRHLPRPESQTNRAGRGRGHPDGASDAAGETVTDPGHPPTPEPDPEIELWGSGLEALPSDDQYVLKSKADADLAEARAECDSLRHAESVLLVECERLREALEVERKLAKRAETRCDWLRGELKEAEDYVNHFQPIAIAGRELAEAVERVGEVHADDCEAVTKQALACTCGADALVEALTRFREAME